MNIVFAVVGARPEVRRELDLFGFTEKIGEEHYFDALDDALAAFRGT